MPKNLKSISQKRLVHLFIGTHGLTSPKEAWYEAGHFREGVTIGPEPINEKNGSLQFESPLGWQMQGTLENVQNTQADLQFYEQKMQGIKNVAYQIGSMLWLFRIVKDNNSITDNRISMSTKIPYESQMQIAMTTLGGLIDQYERIEIKGEASIVNGKLKFDPLFPAAQSIQGNNFLNNK